MHYIGVDLGGTNIKAGVVDASGDILVKDVCETRAEGGPSVVIKRICQIIDGVREKGSLSWEKIDGVGVGSPGTLDHKTGVIFHPPNLPGWRNVPLRDEVAGNIPVGVIVENDANAAAWGEYWAGAGREVHSMVMLTLGTGIGGGIILEGKLVRGAHDSAAELGHTIIVRDGVPCGCGSRGCLEVYASATAVVRRFKEAVGAGRDTTLVQAVKEDKEITSKMIYEAAVAGDELAREVMEETGRYLGTGIVSIMNTVNPARIVLSGGMIHAGEMIMRPLKETVQELAFPIPAEKTEIVFATLGEDAGFIGAAGLALERLQPAKAK
jgi:glucokinase